MFCSFRFYLVWIKCCKIKKNASLKNITHSLISQISRIGGSTIYHRSTRFSDPSSKVVSFGNLFNWYHHFFNQIHLSSFSIGSEVKAAWKRASTWWITQTLRITVDVGVSLVAKHVESDKMQVDSSHVFLL